MREILAAGEELYALAQQWAEHYAREAHKAGARDGLHPAHQAVLDRWRKAAESALSSPAPDVEALADLLRRWQDWEARWIMCDAAWVEGLPKLTQDLYDEYVMGLQADRERILAALKPAEPDAPQQTHQPECCVWPYHGGFWADPHDESWKSMSRSTDGQFCPHCGKPIRLEARP